MMENLEEDETLRLLMTIPGIGLILAHVIRAEIGEIERFPRFDTWPATPDWRREQRHRRPPRAATLQPACNHVLRGLSSSRTWRATDQSAPAFACDNSPCGCAATASGGLQEFGESGRCP